MNCFTISNKRFCKTPSNNWDCEIDVMNKIYSNPNCFKKVQKRNNITQIQDSTYFVIFNSLFMQIKCGNAVFLIELTNHMKIINNKQCSSIRHFLNIYSLHHNTEYLFQTTRIPTLFGFPILNRENLNSI